MDTSPGSVRSSPHREMFLRSNKRFKDGKEHRYWSIVESVRTRIRPILMSSLTSVMGLLPLILAPGAGSELYRGLGAVVAGGLLVSTLFTIVLVPLVMSVVVRDKPSVGRTGA